MAGGLDFGKSREWAERLERYERSGLTVARWCESEEVSKNILHCAEGLTEDCWWVLL